MEQGLDTANVELYQFSIEMSTPPPPPAMNMYTTILYIVDLQYDLMTNFWTYPLF